jgi:hypothetical protein
MVKWEWVQHKPKANNLKFYLIQGQQIYSYPNLLAKLTHVKIIINIPKLKLMYQ